MLDVGREVKASLQGRTAVYCFIRCLELRNTLETSRVTLKYYIWSLNTEIWASSHRHILIKAWSPGCLASDNFLIELIPSLKVWWETWQEIVLWVEDRNLSAAAWRVHIITSALTAIHCWQAPSTELMNFYYLNCYDKCITLIMN